MLRRTLIVLVLMALAWPTVAAAEDEPTDTTEVPPDTTGVPTDTTDVPPDTTEVPPDDTVVAEEPPEEPEPADEVDLEGTRSMTVSPHRNLVHDEVVHVRGTGWPARTFMGAAQCVEGIGDVSGCGPIHYFTTGRLGGFNTVMQVDVILDTQAGTFDCRVDQCLIGANDQVTVDGAQTVLLEFDPAGPDPVRRTATVDPDTDLVDGRRVLVTGDGFEVIDPGFGGYAELVQCVGEPASGTCDDGTLGSGHVDLTGRLRTHYEVLAILHTDAVATHDCRTGGCTLAVRDYDEGLSEAAAVPLGFDPNGALLPPPTLELDPDTGVRDGDVVEAEGTGWQPNSFVALLQCLPGGGDYVEVCDFRSYGFGDVDDTGALEGYLGVRARIRVEEGVVDCRTEACVVRALPYERPSRFVEESLGFDPAGRLLRPRIEASPTTGLVDGQLINVRTTEVRPGEAVLIAQCLATATEVGDCDLNGSTYLEVPIQESMGGSARGEVRVHRVIQTVAGHAVNCRRRHCALTMLNPFSEQLRPGRRVALHFAPTV